MKNREIIADAAVKAELLTKEKAEEMLRDGIEIPLHTIQGWRSRGDIRSVRVKKEWK